MNFKDKAWMQITERNNGQRLLFVYAGGLKVLPPSKLRYIMEKPTKKTHPVTIAKYDERMRI